MKRSNTITSIVDTSLITSTAINGEVSIAIFERGVGWLFGIALSGASPLFSLVAAIARISFQLFTRKP